MIMEMRAHAKLCARKSWALQETRWNFAAMMP
jgi:hypothetical protein